MPDKIKLDIVSAEEEIFSQEVEMIYAPAEMGDCLLYTSPSPRDR